ncbi:uncharacterized protein LOC128882877 [Hylaeus volcanicus]|uniref:uncharacterized protein LOC128882877 n=1 Tax=Hylaeus volcanicus TaxID=313075 RepID=UPI0023B7BBF7|nr:uncharacterized protein LOC128882877 [Hylaeus volcanicus]
MKMIRVMYLHALRGTTKGERTEKLKEACKDYHLITPDLKTRTTLLIFTLTFAAYLCCVSALVCLAWAFISTILAFFITTLLFLCVCITYILVGRGVTHSMVVQATAIAEKVFWEFRPNVIVASSFGAVIVFAMQVPKVSLVLLAPGQDAYCRYFKMKRIPTLRGYPYVIVVHGCNDDEILLEDSIRLIDNSSYLQCKLEVIDDTHSLNSLTANDYKELIEETFQKGRQHILEIMENKNESLPVPHTPYRYRSQEINPSFFLISAETGAKEESKIANNREQNEETPQDTTMTDTDASFNENLLGPYTKPL